MANPNQPILEQQFANVIQIEITQFAKDMAKQIFPLMTKQYTDPTSTTMTATAMTMPMTLLPMTAPQHGHFNPVDLAAIHHEIELVLMQCATTSPANAEDPDTMTAPTTPPNDKTNLVTYSVVIETM